MSFSTGFNVGFYSGGALSADAPGRYPVALDGHPYLIDLASNRFRHVTIPVLKQQTQTSDALGEQSINPNGLWRRSLETWHHGAGQSVYDLADSDPARFRTSKGIDVWTRWEMSLHPDTDEKRSSANTNLQLQPAGSRLYLIDGGDIVYTTDVTAGTPTWTGITGEPATAATSICSDGFNVWTAHGADRVYLTDTSASATAAYVTSGNSVSLVAYVKGRLMAAHDNLLYNITATGALPSPLYTHNNSDFTWVGFAAGRSCIYAAGYSGDKSLIYRTAVKADGTALDTPVVAGELPDGEIVRSVYGYLGFLLIGTDQGIRFAVGDDNGDLTIGALIDLGVSVRCFEGQGSFVWFGWTNYDSTSTGLGRLSLTTILDGGAPAYASDLMATDQGTVLSACTFQDIRVFAVSAAGVYAQDTALVASGALDTGQISYGISDNKVAAVLDVRHEPLDGAVAAAVSVDGGSWSTRLTSSTEDSTGTNSEAGDLRGERYELRATLTRAATTTLGPTVTRIVLSSNVTADTGFRIIAPVMLNAVDDVPGSPARNPAAELAFIESLRASRRTVPWQEGSRTYAVSLEDFEWVPIDRVVVDNEVMWTGTAVLDLKVI